MITYYISHSYPIHIPFISQHPQASSALAGQGPAYASVFVQDEDAQVPTGEDGNNGEFLMRTVDLHGFIIDLSRKNGHFCPKQLYLRQETLGHAGRMMDQMDSTRKNHGFKTGRKQ